MTFTWASILAISIGPLLGLIGALYGVRTNLKQNRLRLEFDTAAEERQTERDELEQRDRRANEWREDYMAARRDIEALRKEQREAYGEHRVEIDNLRREHGEEIASLRKEQEEVVAVMRSQHDHDLTELRDENARLRVRVADMEKELSTKRVVASVSLSTSTEAGE